MILSLSSSSRNPSPMMETVTQPRAVGVTAQFGWMPLQPPWIELGTIGVLNEYVIVSPVSGLPAVAPPLSIWMSAEAVSVTFADESGYPAPLLPELSCATTDTACDPSELPALSQVTS